MLTCLQRIVLLMKYSFFMCQPIMPTVYAQCQAFSAFWLISAGPQNVVCNFHEHIEYTQRNAKVSSFMTKKIEFLVFAIL